MGLTNISMIIATIIGLVLIIMSVPYATLFLYFIPATIIVNFIRIWEKKS